MLAKKHNPFTSLKRSYKDSKVSPSKPADFSYPTLYVSDIELPLDEEDLNKVMTVDAKIKLKSISRNIRNGKETVSYDLEVQGIKV